MLTQTFETGQNNISPCSKKSVHVHFLVEAKADGRGLAGSGKVKKSEVVLLQAWAGAPRLLSGLDWP